MSPRTGHKAQLVNSRELLPGKMIGRLQQDSFIELFTIVGTSHADVALVRMFEERDLTSVLSSKCIRVLHALTLSISPEQLQPPVYADVTTLFYQQKETILLNLNNASLVLAGKIHKKDLAAIVDALLKCNSISIHEKTSFLTF